MTTAFRLSSGDANAAVLASAALPALFPAVEMDGGLLVDGGVVDHTPIHHAVSLGADRVVVLATGYACALTETPTRVIASAVHALTLLIQQRLVFDLVGAAHDHVDLLVLPRRCSLSESPTDFRHRGELIARGGPAAGRWLNEGGDRLEHPERFLSRHSHDIATSTFADASGGHAA